MRKSYVKYEEILSFDLFEENYRHICRNTKHKKKLIKYDLFKHINIFSLYEELSLHKYQHGRYNIFLISEPKYRIVMSENIRDKLTNHLVSNVFLKPVLYPKLIEENVATRVGKGTNAAIEYCKKYFVRMMNKYEKFYVLKFDISKYFYKIDHRILLDKLKEVYVDENILKLIEEIVKSTDGEYINGELDRCIDKEKTKILERGDEKNIRDSFKELDKIPHYEKGRGLGIGSLSSQIFAIFYLNSLDHFIKENLDIKEYIRFMDDGVIFSESKERLKEIKDIIEKELAKLKLNLNYKKTAIFSSKGGFEFVGYRFIERNGKLLVKIKTSTKKRMKRKFKKLETKNKEKLVRVKASYKGFLQYCTTNSLYRKYIDDDRKDKVFEP